MSRFIPATKVTVELRFDQDTILPVGRLAIKDRVIFFEYDATFIHTDLQISPFRLPLKSGLIRSDPHLFEGLPGVFNDSLPDGWGRLLLDRKLRSHQIEPARCSPLDRLCAVGQQAMGALTYLPDYSDISEQDIPLNLANLAEQAALIQEKAEFSEQLFRLNGSSAGARPKALIGLHAQDAQIIPGVGDVPAGFQHWIVKFNQTYDDPQSGLIEYAYARMAQLAGVEMPAVRLLQERYFATQRFDRQHNQRRHVVSACGLLHADFRTPCLDYQDLIRACSVLTRSVRQVEKLYRLAVFNVLSHNRDDHAKNFSFILDKTGDWIFSPAYDITYSSGPNGEQSTLLMGESQQFTRKHLTDLAKLTDIRPDQALTIIEQTTQALSQWPAIAAELGIVPDTIRTIARRHTLHP
ncbi:MAG: type II toxin-antitoxin system HipA family toxin [Pseudomonadota bacterium]